MSYMAFKHKVVHLRPTMSQALELEKNFSVIRSLHNHFTSQLQKFPDEVCKKLVRTYPELRMEIERLAESNPENYGMFMKLPTSILDSHLRIIANTWEGFAKGVRSRPTIKTSRHQQGFWLLDQSLVAQGIDIIIPGNTEHPEGHAAIRLEDRTKTLQGDPVVCKVVRRQHDYYLLALYEQPADGPDPSAENLINHWSISLAEHIKRNSAFRRNLYKRSRERFVTEHEYSASLLRMDILGKLSGPYLRRFHHQIEGETNGSRPDSPGGTLSTDRREEAAHC